jgi:hypothetical protein
MGVREMVIAYKVEGLTEVRFSHTSHWLTYAAHSVELAVRVEGVG